MLYVKQLMTGIHGEFGLEKEVVGAPAFCTNAADMGWIGKGLWLYTAWIFCS